MHVRSSGECDLDWGAPMAWGWPFLLRLAGAHRRRRRPLQLPATASTASEDSLLASLPATGPPIDMLCHTSQSCCQACMLLSPCPPSCLTLALLFSFPLLGAVSQCLMDKIGCLLPPQLHFMGGRGSVSMLHRAGAVSSVV